MNTCWASIPSSPPPLRPEWINWYAGSRDLVDAFIQRQATAEVLAWIEARAAEYGAGKSDEKPLRLWYESAVDLIAWQRGVTAARVLEWLRQWDEVAAGIMKDWAP